MRETITPALQRIVVWAGANLGSFAQAQDALRLLAQVDLSTKRIRRITQQAGQDRLTERQQQVADFQQQPLMHRLTPPAQTPPVDLGVVMMDGGRYQRRDHFGEDAYTGSHWKEDKVGIVLHMHNGVYDSDPQPLFPEWLASADVVREIAALGAIDAENTGNSTPLTDLAPTPDSAPPQTAGWSEFAPKLLSREVVASSACGADFGWHLEHAAWRQGVVNATRMAFVADGAAVNWAIHRQHFSQMIGVLDLMHALSYAWKASRALDDAAAYRLYATWIWQGCVGAVISALQARLADGTLNDEQYEAVQRAVTYYEHHRARMDYPTYRCQGLPLTSSHIESTIKQINRRMKGSEKFFRRETGETLLQLRADSISDSAPLGLFWTRWLAKQSGANTYRTQPV